MLKYTNRPQPLTDTAKFAALNLKGIAGTLTKLNVEGAGKIRQNVD